MLLSDTEIRRWCKCDVINGGLPLITPFVEGVSQGVVSSYGLTSCGYDVRLSRKAKILKASHCEILDPVLFADPDYCKRVFDEIECDIEIIAPPHSYLLVMAHEWVNMPRSLSGMAVGKSTYARLGIICNTTPMEPEWRGHLTIELANTSPLPVRLRVGQGIAQFRFERIEGDVETSYAGKKGKYQNQTDVTPARVKEVAR